MNSRNESGHDAFRANVSLASRASVASVEGGRRLKNPNLIESDLTLFSS